MAEDRTGSELADVAILFVHGIGSQKPGVTLSRWTEPLYSTLQAACRNLDLKPERPRVADATKDSARVEFDIARPDGTPIRWVALEARWADEFQPSSATEVFLWILRFWWRVFSRAVTTSARLFSVSLIRRAPAELRGRWGLGLWILLPPVCFCFFFIAPAILVPYAASAAIMLAAVVIGIPLTILGCVVLLMLQYVPGVGKSVSALTSGLVTSLGDAQAYRQREIQAAAMRGAFLTRYAAAQSIAREVVVVAHSQGAAIATSCLLQERVAWPRLLFTVGAAINLLNDERTVDEWLAKQGPRWIDVWTPFDPVPAGPVAKGARETQERLLETAWHQIYGGFVIRSTTDERHLAWVWSPKEVHWEGTPELVDLALHCTVKTIDHRWTAVRTDRNTPCPNNSDDAEKVALAVLQAHGILNRYEDRLPAPRAFQAVGPEEWPVENAYSQIMDHFLYAKNLTQVQYGLVRELLLASGLTSDECPPAMTEEVRRSGTRRVQLLASTRIVSALTGLAAYLSIRDTSVFKPIESATRKVVSILLGKARIPFTSEEKVQEFLTQLSIAIVLTLLVYLLLRSMWQYWNSQAEIRCCERPQESAWSMTGRLAVFLVMYAAAIVYELSVLFQQFEDVVWFRILGAPSFLLVLPLTLFCVVWPVHARVLRPIPARTHPS